jgi:hypothetical protein
MLVSQALACNNLNRLWQGNQKLNLASTFVCDCIGPRLKSKPSDPCLRNLAAVNNELKRHRVEMGSH